MVAAPPPVDGLRPRLTCRGLLRVRPARSLPDLDLLLLGLLPRGVRARYLLVLGLRLRDLPVSDTHCCWVRSCGTCLTSILCCWSGRVDDIGDRVRSRPTEGRPVARDEHRGQRVLPRGQYLGRQRSTTRDRHRSKWDAIVLEQHRPYRRRSNRRCQRRLLRALLSLRTWHGQHC
jgi:hypothetical protein